jgi:hypothetical protein
MDYRPYCKQCGWMPNLAFGDLVKLDVGYILAKLKADGAEPGWYGPDGKRWEKVWGLCAGEACLVLGATSITLQFARLCGFVEVPND